jgi:hypothetical protein
MVRMNPWRASYSNGEGASEVCRPVHAQPHDVGEIDGLRYSAFNGAGYMSPLADRTITDFPKVAAAPAMLLSEGFA